MRRLSAEALLTVTASWACGSCAEPQVAIAGIQPPADGLCADCRDRREAMILTPRLDAAAVPRAIRRDALAGRASWSVHFRRRWPRALADGRAISVAYLWGPTGTGKTTAAAILLAEQLAAGRDALWVDGIEIRYAVKRAFNAGPASELDRVLAVPVVVYDEPLAGEPTPWDLSETVYRIVRAREGQGRTTIITSQIDPADLLPEPPRTPLFPPPLVSRMLGGVRVWMGEEDARLRVEASA